MDTRNLQHLPQSTLNRLEQLEPEKLTPNPRNARTHSKKQVQQIADSICAFGFNNPILVDESYQVVAGHGRLAAAKLLGLPDVPVVRLDHLTDAEKRAYVLADNKIAQNAGWDIELLSSELGDLAEMLPDIDLSLEVTGFETGEIDLFLTDNEAPSQTHDRDDDLPALQDSPRTQRGEIWQLDRHRILCGDARDGSGVKCLFGAQSAKLVITDPPYNVRVTGHVGGRGKTKHPEFAFASGEMSPAEFRAFLTESLTTMLKVTDPAALLYSFMDWRHIEDLLACGRDLGLSLKNLCVWHKSTPGQGSFYRSAHEMVAVFARPDARTENNIRLGKFGRNRTNVWTYPGVNTFDTRSDADLALHPTVKPIAMIADAIKDASKRGNIVFDPFLGSGTPLLAAEKTGRTCFAVEYEPRYVDLAIRRWQHMTGKDAVLARLADGSKPERSSLGTTFDARVASEEEAQS